MNPNSPTEPTNTNFTVPPQPAPTPSPSPEPTLATPAAPPVATPPVAIQYTSNPFLVTVKGLVALLTINPVSILLSGVVLLLGFFGFVIAIALLNLAAGDGGSALSGVVAFVGYILLLPFIMGVYLSISSATVNKTTVSLGQSFAKAASKLLPLLGLVIVLFVLIVVGLILLVVPGIIIAARTSLAGLIMFNENVGPITAIKRSFTLTKGHTMEMIGAMFAGGLFSGESLLLPAVSAAPMIGRYTEITALKAAGASKPKTHWLNYLVIIAVVALIGFVVFISVVANSFAPKTQDSTTFPDSSFPSSQYDETYYDDTNYDSRIY